jgi:bacillopeptidase F
MSFLGSVGGFVDKTVLGRDPNLHFIVQLKDQADLSQVAAMPRGADRRVAAWNALTAEVQQTQPAVTAVLDQLKAKGVVVGYSSMPLGNTLFIDTSKGGHDALVNALNATGKVGLVVNESSEDGHGEMVPTPAIPSHPVRVTADADPSSGSDMVVDPKTGDQIGWNVHQVGAEQAWAEGATGQGVTVGLIDTGIDTNNPAVANAYRGTGGSNDYNWHDFVGGKPAPYDDGAHGSHTGGTVAGHEKGIDVGVAPGAKIIEAKGLGPESGSDQQLMSSLQWMLAPTDVKGNNPKPELGADIVSNSWGGEAGDPASVWSGQLYEQPLKEMKDAGIVTIFAAGNSGPGIATVGPPGNIADTITVAATDNTDNVASFSSRGPVTDLQNHGHGTLNKPDIAAPGVAVPSSIPTRGSFPELAIAAAMAKMIHAPGADDMSPVPGTAGHYFTMDGTSMATPCTAGVAALVLSKYPTLDPTQVKQVLMSSAKDIDVPGWDPNTGAGRVDAPAALSAAAKLLGQPDPTPPPAPAAEAPRPEGPAAPQNLHA